MDTGHEESGEEVLCLPGQGKEVPSRRAAWEARHFQRDPPPVPGCLTCESKACHWMVGPSLACVLIK